MEVCSTYVREMMGALLNVHALVNMGRASQNFEYFKMANQWIPNLERMLESLKQELKIQSEIK